MYYYYRVHIYTRVQGTVIERFRVKRYIWPKIEGTRILGTELGWHHSVFYSTLKQNNHAYHFYIAQIFKNLLNFELWKKILLLNSFYVDGAEWRCTKYFPSGPCQTYLIMIWIKFSQYPFVTLNRSWQSSRRLL